MRKAILTETKNKKKNEIKNAKVKDKNAKKKNYFFLKNTLTGHKARRKI